MLVDQFTIQGEVYARMFEKRVVTAKYRPETPLMIIGVRYSKTVSWTDSITACMDVVEICAAYILDGRMECSLPTLIHPLCVCCAGFLETRLKA